MSEDVPGYRVLEQVGEGGFSVVYRAHQERLDRMVALKVLSVASVDDTAMRRFQRECKITGRLSGHPNVVTVLDTGTTGSGSPYIAMEYFEHGALSDRLAREGALGVPDVLRVGVKMAGALAATHETDVLHRDIKPQNILLSRYGEPALADFGIARLVDSFDATHTQAFTPHHAAPEIVQGAQPGVGADIYSLGSTLYQLLADRPAFKGPPGEGIGPLVLRVMNDAPPRIPRPDVPQQVQDIIGRAMAKTPEQRFGSAVEFAQALQQVQAELGLPITELAHGGAATLPHPGGTRSAMPLADTGGSSLGAAGTAPGRPSFPDASGPPPVPNWASTVSAPPSSAPPAAPPAGQPPAAAQPGVAGADAPPAWQPHTAPHTTPGLTTPHPQYAPQAPHAPHSPVQAPAPAGGPAEPHDGPKRGLIVAASVALVGGLALGVGALMLSGGDGSEPGATPTAPAAAPTNAGPSLDPITPAELAAAQPRKVKAKAMGNGAVLTWKLPPAAKKLPLLIQQYPVDTMEVRSMGQGTETTTVPNIRPNVANCFRIGAVVRVVEGKAPDVSWSEKACVYAKKQRG